MPLAQILNDSDSINYFTMIMLFPNHMWSSEALQWKLPSVHSLWKFIFRGLGHYFFSYLYVYSTLYSKHDFSCTCKYWENLNSQSKNPFNASPQVLLFFLFGASSFCLPLLFGLCALPVLSEILQVLWF